MLTLKGQVNSETVCGQISSL